MHHKNERAQTIELFWVYKKKKRLIRIELTQVAWKATVLPLNYRRIKICLRFLTKRLFFSKEMFSCALSSR